MYDFDIGLLNALEKFRASADERNGFYYSDEVMVHDSQLQFPQQRQSNQSTPEGEQVTFVARQAMMSEQTNILQAMYQSRYQNATPDEH